MAEKNSAQTNRQTLRK